LRAREKCESIQNDSKEIRRIHFLGCARCVNVSRYSIVICNQSLLLSYDDDVQHECHLMLKVMVQKKWAFIKLSFTLIEI